MAIVHMLELLLRPAFLAPAVVLLAWVMYQIFKPARPLNLPILGAEEGDWFPMIQATWRNTKNFKGAVKLQYSKYRDQPVILPMAGISKNTVLLPSSHVQFIIDQPDTVLSLHKQAIDDLQIDYTVVDPELVHNPVHHRLITTTLTNQIGNLVPDVMDEIEWGFERHWGTDTSGWKEACVYETMRRIIGSVTNRVFVGLPDCRNPALLDAAMAYAQDVPLTSTMLKFLPRPARPLVSPFLTLPNRIHTHQFYQVIRPEIERRLKEYDARSADPESKHLGSERNDLLQWSLRQAKESGDPSQWHPKKLSGRILILNFAAIHTSSFSITNAILDLVASKPEYISELRDEISSVLAEQGGQWNKRGLAKMEKLDSVLRESTRLNSFVTVGLSRKVVAKEGLTTPSGVHLPYGTTIVVPGYSVMQDPDIYEDAQTFKPFRFAQQRSDHSVEYVQRARQAFATTSSEYLAFGHGREACPGRFFAANELKLVLAHLVLNYDLEMQEGRPRNLWFGINRVPPMKATVRIKRRETI